MPYVTTVPLVRSSWLLRYVALLMGFVITPTAGLAEDSVATSLATVVSVGPEGQQYGKVIAAAERLRAMPASQLPVLLDGFAGINPLAENWLRGIVFDIVRARGEAPAEMLQRYIEDQNRNPIGRGLAMELLRQQDSETAQRMISDLLNDPSLRLREMAVHQAIERASALAEDRRGEAISIYKTTLAAARNPRQVAKIIEALKPLGETVRPAEAFAMITKWHAVAPFDNVNGVGFDAVYPPESEYLESGTVDLENQYPGKPVDGQAQSVAWQTIQSGDDDGGIDLAAAYDKEKGAVCYLYVEFHSSDQQPAQARLGCINANKVWVNGQLLMSNEVYHAGSMVDQYIAATTLQPGANRILLKICQNEQTESWAQDWKFQFRITDPTGKGLTLEVPSQ